MSGAGNQLSILAAAMLALAAAVGIAAAALPTAAAVASLGLGAGVLVLILLRRAAPRPTAPPEWFPEAETEPASDGLRISRALFYLGALTLTQAAWRPIAGVTISELFFLAAFAGALFAVLRGQRVASVPAGLIAAVGVFAFGGAISTAGATAPVGSATEVLQGIYVMLMWVWTGAMVLVDRRQIFVALTLWTVSAAISGFGAISQSVGFDSLTGPLVGSGRATGFTQHPNDLGGAAGIALVPALLLATRWSVRERQLIRAGRWAIVALITAAIILSGSVAGVLSGLLALVVWLSSPAVRAPLRVGIVGALALCLVVVAGLAAGRIASPAERITEVLGQETQEGSADFRAKHAEGAWSRIAENPVVGAGLGKVDNRVWIIGRFGRGELNQPHGLVVASWFASGIFGLLGVLAVFGVHARNGWRAIKATRDAEDLTVAWALLGSLAAFFVYANSAPLFFHQFGWVAAVMLASWSAQLIAHPKRSDSHQPSSAGLPPREPARAVPGWRTVGAGIPLRK